MVFVAVVFAAAAVAMVVVVEVVVVVVSNLLPRSDIRSPRRDSLLVLL